MRKAISFILDDGSGCCVIDVEGAEINLGTRKRGAAKIIARPNGNCWFGDLIYARGEFLQSRWWTMELDARRTAGNLAGGMEK